MGCWFRYQTTDIAHFSKLQQKGLPVVFFDRVPDDTNTHKVEANNFKASYEATAYLIKEGHTRIAQITSNPSVSITKQRLAGYHQALSDHQIIYDDRYVQYCLHGGFDMDEVEQVVDTLLKMDKPPQAIIAASDRITTNCITLLYRLKYRIPQDIALLGFSNNDLIHVLSPQIPIIELPAFEMGVAAAELLMRSIKNSATPFGFQSLDARLIVK
jgi:LacI family transcriptional regulator